MSLAMLGVMGCSKETKNIEGSQAASATGAAGVGINDSANDKAVVEAAKAALTCDWGAQGLKSDCPAYKTWRESPLIKDGKADATLINFLIDPQDAVRWLGATTLGNSGKAYKTDAALSNKLIAAAKVEKQPLVGGALGRTVGNIDAKATNLGEAMKTLATTHALTDLRKSLVSNMLFPNRDSFYDFHLGLARNEKNDDVRRAALGAPWTGTPTGRAGDTCKMWLERVDDPKPDNGGEAAYMCAFWSNSGGCQSEWDALLSKIDARAKSGQVQASQMASALSYLYGQKGATAAQKARSINVSKAILENASNNAAARGTALRFLAEADPPMAKAVAKKFENDKEFFVKNTAKDVLDGKIQPKK